VIVATVETRKPSGSEGPSDSFVCRWNRAGQRGLQDEPRLEEEFGEIGMYLPRNSTLESVSDLEDAPRMARDETEEEVAKNTVHRSSLQRLGPL
jgi:hypothetical protein